MQPFFNMACIHILSIFIFFSTNQATVCIELKKEEQSSNRYAKIF